MLEAIKELFAIAIAFYCIGLGLMCIALYYMILTLVIRAYRDSKNEEDHEF
jgi:hypothetical protein